MVFEWWDVGGLNLFRESLWIKFRWVVVCVGVGNGIWMEWEMDVCNWDGGVFFEFWFKIWIW